MRRSTATVANASPTPADESDEASTSASRTSAMGLTRSIPPTGWTFGAVSAAPANVRLANMEVFPGISMDPDVRFGKPCLTGTRIDDRGSPRGW